MRRRTIWNPADSSGEERKAGPAPANRIAAALRSRAFFWTIEFVVSARHEPAQERIVLDKFVCELGARPEIAGFSITDRVTGDDDPDPVAVGAEVAARTGMQPLIHWSGKGRVAPDLEASIERMQARGLQNVLFVTGDKLRSPGRHGRDRYLESVNAVYIARRRMKGLTAAVALNPFKYREAESMAQYLKLSKKVTAGADFVITQIGFDPTKHEEALFWMHANRCRVPVVANLIALNAARARYIRRHKLAGVYISDDLAELLEHESASLSAEEASARVMRRMALQIQKLFYSGYSGIQATGLHSVEKLLQLRHAVDTVEREVTDRLTWDEAWREALSFGRSGSIRVAGLTPPGAWYMTNRAGTEKPNWRDRTNNRIMRRLHGSMFESGLGARLMRRLLNGVRRGDRVDRGLTKLERAIKGPLVGCEACGTCRLAVMQYLCPETCPKGLANGACGGTELDRCEFGDRECVHSRRYRLARDSGELEEMSELLIEDVPESSRGTSSWPPYLRDGAPVLDD